MPKCKTCGEPIEHGDQWRGDGARPSAYCTLDCMEDDRGRAAIVVVTKKKGSKRMAQKSGVC